MILILTEAADPHADHVEQKLRERGADFMRLNPAQFPSKVNLSLSYSATGRQQGLLRTDERTLDLGPLEAVWYRRPQPPVPHEEITDQACRDYLKKECQIYLSDVWDSLDCRCVPAPPAVIRRAELKASQLKTAGALGFEIPETLFTNSPEEFLEFYRRHSGQIVSKLASASFHGFAGSTFMRYTQLVSRADVSAASAVRFCPVIFQSYVPKRVELRVTIVGQEVFAAEIHSQQTNHTRHDWRRYDYFQTPYLPHELPPDVARRCVKLVARLGLCYGAIDLVLTPDGRYVFLEINPNGQYLWVEQETGLPISDAICNLLMSGATVGAAAAVGSLPEDDDE